MNEGIFEDERHQDILEMTAEEIRLLIEETAKPRPPKKTVHFVRVEMQTGEGRFSVVNWAFRCDSTEEAKRRLRHHITEENGHIYDLYEKWTDSDGNEHRCEYFITEGEYEDWEEGYEGVCNYDPDYSQEPSLSSTKLSRCSVKVISTPNA